jgi:uncharacterized phiE125 gp8 family phage protein
MNYKLIAGPAVEPVTVDEAKFAARLDGTAFDAALPGYIVAARQLAEQETQRQLITQTWRLGLREWCDGIELKRSPFKSVEAVEYWSGSAWVAVSSGSYVVDEGVAFATVRPALNTTWPTLGAAVGDRVRVTFKAGYGDTGAAVPESIKLWMKAQVAYWVRNPEAANERAMTASPFLSSLLDPERIF